MKSRQSNQGRFYFGANHYDQQNKPKVTCKVVDRLQKVGYYVTLQPIEAPVPPYPAPVEVAKSSLSDAKGQVLKV